MSADSHNVQNVIPSIQAMRQRRRARAIARTGGKPWTVYMTTGGQRVRCEEGDGYAAFATFKAADTWCQWMRRQWEGMHTYEVGRVRLAP